MDYAPYPHDSVMRHPLYGYVRHSYLYTDHWRFFEEPNRYVLVVLKKEFRLPENKKIYNFLIKNDAFVQVSLPIRLDPFILFIRKNLRAVK